MWNDPRTLAKHVPSLTYCVCLYAFAPLCSVDLYLLLFCQEPFTNTFYPQETHDIETLRRFFIYKMFFFMTDLIPILRPSRCLTVVSVRVCKSCGEGCVMLCNDKWDLLLHRGIQSYLKIKSTDSSPALNSTTLSCSIASYNHIIYSVEEAYIIYLMWHKWKIIDML